jgi:hypothetical protein
MPCLTPPDVVLVHQDIKVSVECDCSDNISNVLVASDGVLYSSEPEPIFVTK